MGSKCCWVCNQINTVLPAELYGECTAAAASSSSSSRCIRLFPLPSPLLLWHYFKFCIGLVRSKLRSSQVSRVFCTSLPGPLARRRGRRAGSSRGASKALPTLGFLHTGTLAMNKDLQIKYCYIAVVRKG